MNKITTYDEFMAEAERLDPDGFAKARAERAEAAALRKDAYRWRKLQAVARQYTAFDIYGSGCLWSIGVHSNDRRLSFADAVDALPVVGAV